ncbi:NADH-quinone oxidoreductase subunit N [Acidobacteriota bacterium]
MDSLQALFPLLTVVAGALLIMLLEVIFKRENKTYLAFVSLVTLILSGYFAGQSWNKDLSYFNGHLTLDNVALLFSLILIIATIFVTLISMKYLTLHNTNHGEYYALLLLALSGMIIMVSSQDMLVIFLGLEVLSMSSYALAGLKRDDPKSTEASLKYFLLGSFASAFLVYGLALLYGAAGSIKIPAIITSFQSGDTIGPMAYAGLGLVIIGLGFKIAVIPFHMWTPDVYQGAPTPITAFFSIGPKAVGFAVLFRLLFPYWKVAMNDELVHSVLWVIAVLTMVIANLIALRQTNVKRILAYSSIAHAGYLLVAVLAQDTSSLLFYFVVYLFMNIGAFAALIAMGNHDEEYHELEDFAGIGFKYPWIGATFAIFLFSLAGLPPTGGFLAKFYVFSAAVREGLIALVIIGVLASLISVYYYLRIIVYMYMREPSREISVYLENPALFLVLFLCLYGVLQLGIFPGNVLIIIRQAVSSIPFL